MKTNFDHLYETALNNGLKRRRAVAILTVLSMIVSSGVLWSLRETGVTMVNELSCEYEEHQHTDECYEKTLICDLEGNEDHTHTDECFEMDLICDLPVHIHGMGCEFSEEEEVEEQEDYPVVELGEILDEEGSGYNEEISNLAAPSDIQVLAAGQDPHPGTIDTFDNTIDGIKINFFDYGTELLDQGEMATEYNGNEADNTKVNHFGEPKAEGINRSSGFEGNDMDAFFLFFAYGTPTAIVEEKVFDGQTSKIVRPTWNNYSGSWKDGEKYPAEVVSGNRPVQGIVAPVLAKNANNGVTYPLLNGKTWGLEHLFGEFNIRGWSDGKGNPQNDNESDPTKTFYKNVTHLMKKDQTTGRYSYYSDQNYACFNIGNIDTDKSADGEPSAGRFTVYDQTYKIFEGTGEEHNDRPIGFFPFDPYPTTYVTTESGIDIYRDEGDTEGKNYIYGNPTHKTRKNNDYGDEHHDYNHHFGMTLEAKFTMSSDSNYQYKGQDIEFSYSGDDDMWVFVDDVLVLDLGGIHEPAAGQINFTEGYVLVQDNAYGDYITCNPQYEDNDSSKKRVSEGLREVTKLDADSSASTYYNKNNQSHQIKSGLEDDIISGEVLLNCMRRYGDNKLARMDYYDLETLFNENARKGNALISGGLDKIWDQDAEHTIKIFYLERGGSYSNLAMEFCLPFTEQLTVEKEVSDESNRDEMVKEDKEFSYQLFIKDTNTNQFIEAANKDYIYIEKNGSTSKGTTLDGTFTLKRGEKIIFQELSPDMEYYVKECGVDSEIFDKVEFIGNSGNSNKDNQSESLPDNKGSPDVIAGCEVDANGQRYYKLSETNYVRFVNHVRYETTGLEVLKSWIDGKPPDGTIIHFKLYRTCENPDGTSGKEVVAYDKHATFALKASDWKKIFENLPVRYGNRKYTYSVLELDCPDGYVSSCSDPVVDENGNLKVTITNKNVSDAEIHVRKDWENADSSQYKITGVLKRKYIEYSDPSPTRLKVNVNDLNGEELIKDYFIPNVYIDGSVEFSLEVPEGAKFEFWDYQLCEKGDIEGYYSEEIENGETKRYFIFEVQKIQNGANVTITLDTSNVPNISGYLYRASFNDGTDGWDNRGNANVEHSRGNQKAKPYATGGMLYISGRGDNWNTAKYQLPANFFEKGKKYNFHVCAMATTDNEQFTFQLDYGGGHYGTLRYNVASKGSYQWTDLSQNGFEIAQDVDVSKPIDIFVQTASTNPFYIDELVISHAGVDINIEPSLIHDTFDGSKNDWDIRGGGGVNPTDGYLTAYGISEAWGGPIKNSLNLTNESTYSISVDVKYKKTDWSYVKKDTNANDGVSYSPTPDQIKFKLMLMYTDANNNSTYQQVAASSVTHDTWTTIRNQKCIVKIPDGTVDVAVYVETEEPNERFLREFDIDEFIVDHIEPEPEVSNDSAYFIIPNSDSITKTLVEANEEMVDEIWKSEFTLDSNGWTKSWKYGELTSGTPSNVKRKYTYYVEEVAILDSNGQTLTRINPNGESEDGNFLVTYQNNEGVATNSADDPIVICNKYIWYKLPATGGSGTRWIYTMGLGLIAIGTASIIINYRRKRRAG